MYSKLDGFRHVLKPALANCVGLAAFKVSCVNWKVHAAFWSYAFVSFFLPSFLPSLPPPPSFPSFLFVPHITMWGFCFSCSIRRFVLLLLLLRGLLFNTINNTPSQHHHQHNIINTTPSSQHHQHNIIKTTPSTQIPLPTEVIYKGMDLHEAL